MIYDDNEPHPEPLSEAANLSSDIGAVRELRVEDAQLYLDEVKAAFRYTPRQYDDFMGILFEYKVGQLDVSGLLERVLHLFHGNRSLILGLNTFLPPGYKIKIPVDGNGPPVAVYQAPGSEVVQALLENDESRAIRLASLRHPQQQPDQDRDDASIAEGESIAHGDDFTNFNASSE